MDTPTDKQKQLMYNYAEMLIVQELDENDQCYDDICLTNIAERTAQESRAGDFDHLLDDPCSEIWDIVHIVLEDIKQANEEFDEEFDKEFGIA